MSFSQSYSDKHPARLAVFDFDGTIISGQSGSLLARYLFSRGYFSPAKTFRLSWWGIRYALHLPKRQAESREIIFAALNERGSDEIARLMGDFYEKVLTPRYRSHAVDEVRRRHDEGCITLLVSATFQEIAERCAHDLGFDGFIATDMERDAQGNYTGEVEGEVVAGPEKKSAVVRWADEHIGAGAWTVAYAYGDHYSDRDLLGAAVQPFAVTPGRTLRRTARRRDWAILNWK